MGRSEKINDMKKNSGNLKSLVILAITLLATGNLMAQGTPAAATESAASSFWKSDFLPLYILIAIEICVIAYLALMLMQLSKAEQVATGVKHETWIAKLWINGTTKCLLNAKKNY